MHPILASHLFGYLVYLIPAGGLIWFSIFFETDSFGCREMKSTFLLDNSVLPSKNITELYEKRIQFGEKAPLWISGPSNGQLVWNYGFSWSNSNDKNYWTLHNLNDFIKQFNFVGFHDICNYPASNQLESISGGEKGFNSYYSYYYKSNSTGQNLKNI